MKEWVRDTIMMDARNRRFIKKTTYKQPSALTLFIHH